MSYILGYKISDSIYPQMKIIETPKFIFRPICMNDTKDIYEYLSQKKVVRYLPFKAHRNMKETKRFIQNTFINNYKRGKVGNYAIYFKDDKKVIGNIGLNNVSTRAKIGEIGICINPKYWGNNLATELTIVTLITGFEILNLDKLISKTYQKNRYTPKSLNNLRFKYLRSYNSKSYNEVCHIYVLTRQEYFKMKEDYLPNLIREFNGEI